MAQPRCPNCSAEGKEHIVTEEAEENKGFWSFKVVFCNQCGHVYGVVPTYVETP